MYGEYEPETLEKLHRAEAEMFKDFADLCERNKIEYFAISGTAIGAVRHQGFIPWDDDIDVSMPRTDYNRLGEIFSKTPKILGGGVQAFHIR